MKLHGRRYRFARGFSADCKRSLTKILLLSWNQDCWPTSSTGFARGFKYG